MACERRQDVQAYAARLKEAWGELAYLALGEPELPACLDVVVARVREVLEAEFSEVWQLVPEEHSLLMRAGAGWPEQFVGEVEVPVGLDSQAGYTLLVDALQKQGPVSVVDLRTEDRFEPSALEREGGIVSGLSVVAHAWGRPWGVLAVHSRGARGYTDFEADFLQDVAELIGTAVLRCERDEELRRESDEKARLADAAGERLRYITEAISVFGACSDGAEALRALARLAVPRLADWCFVDLLEEDGRTNGRIKRLVVGSDVGTAERLGLTQDLCFRHYPHDPTMPHGTPYILRTHEPELIPEVGEKVLEERTHDEQLRALKSLDPCSYMCVPLQVGPRVIGAAGFVSSDPAKRYGVEDLALARELARLAALFFEKVLEEVPDWRAGRVENVPAKEATIVSAPSVSGLQPAQLTVLALLNDGLTVKEVAGSMFCSEANVRKHLKKINRVLGTRNQVQALARARHLGLFGQG
jgi:GAF domain-containing protein/DNA-binding CsgD family transcriptional regulator